MHDNGHFSFLFCKCVLNMTYHAGLQFYLGALRCVQDPLLLLQVPGYDHGHVHRILLEAILQTHPL